MDRMDTSLLQPALPDAASLGLPELMGQAQALAQQGRADQIAALYQAWLAHHTTAPLRFVALFNYGTVLGGLSKPAEAVAVYREAIAIKADFVQAHLNLGHQLEQLGQLEEALACWRKVIELQAAVANPEQELTLHALNNLARSLEVAKRYDESEAYMVQSLTLNPDQPKVIQHYVHIRQKQCEWPVYQPVGQVTQHQLLVGTSPLALLGTSDDPALQLLAAKTFAHERITPASGTLPKRAPRQPGERIRVGYLSSDFKMHAVGLLTVELLELHDRERFEVYGFDWTTDDGSPMRRRLLKAMDKHVPIGHLDDKTAAQVIHAHEIDVLIDLHGLTSGARPGILGFRPAPVQATYLGLPATCGVPGVDWVICDRYTVPDTLAPYMTEKPLYMPRCYQVSDRQREVAPTPSRATYSLPEDRFVFCSFNNNHKFSEPLFKRWMSILNHVPDSVLWLLADNRWAQENMLRTAEACGVARERLIFAPRVAPAEYLARLQLADLFLDTFPYNAGTTASDCLWMGTPILTCSGNTFISRMAGSLLTAVGLPDLITHSLDEYEQRAIQLGNNTGRVASHKRYLAEHSRASSLFDVPGLVKDLESALEQVVRRS
jgi:predicted O-linked N-acetylglucosamine transferase (SPINDLY family)